MTGDFEDIQIVDPTTSPDQDLYVEELFRLRQRKGMTRREAAQTLHEVREAMRLDYFGR